MRYGLGHSVISCICMFKGCADKEGCEEGRKMAEVSGQEAVYMYTKTKCASTVGRDQCPKMCGACM